MLPAQGGAGLLWASYASSTQFHRGGPGLPGQWSSVQCDARQGGNRGHVEHDPLGRVVRITQGAQPGGRAVAPKRVDLAYDAAGQLTSLVRYADLAGTQLVAESDFGYDQAGRLISLSHFRGQSSFVDYGWSFDAAGRMTQYVNSVDGTADYTSDATGQLTAADYNYQDDESYQYDANGNRVLANGQSYTTGSNNRLLSDGTYRYLYDAEGNRTARFIDANQNGQLDAGDADITQYTWDHRNRLVKVQHRAGYGAAVDRVIENYYDSENRWVRRAINARVPLLRQKQCGNHRMPLLAFRQAVAHGARQFAGHAGGAPAAAVSVE